MVYEKYAKCITHSFTMQIIVCFPVTGSGKRLLADWVTENKCKSVDTYVHVVQGERVVELRQGYPQTQL